MPSRQLSTPRIFYGFLWRGALIGMVGGVVIPTVSLFLFCVGSIMAQYDSAMGAFTWVTVPLGTIIGALAGYGASRLDDTEDPRGHIAVAGLIGLGMGGHIASLMTLMLVIFGGVLIVGKVAGLAGGLLIAGTAAAITRAYYFPLSDVNRYVRTLRWWLVAVAFVIGVAFSAFLLRQYYGLWGGWAGTTLFWAIVTSGVGLLSALFAWLTTPCLTRWYVRALAGDATPPARLPAETRPTHAFPDATA